MKVLIATIFGSLVCVTAGAQTTPVAAPSDIVAIISSVDGEVNLIRLGLEENTKAKVGDQLKNADQLTAISVKANVQLECTNGASQTLMDDFDAILNGAEATSPCAIELEKGTSIATSNPDGSDAGRASIRGGPVAAESQHTQFGVTVPADDAENSEAFVIEGQAAVRRSGEAWTLTDGQLWSARTAAITTVSDARYEALASNFARIDVRRSRSAVNAQAELQLTASYFKAFKSPKNAVAREALVQSYAALAIPESSVTKYNAARRIKPGGTVDNDSPQLNAGPRPPPKLLLNGIGGGGSRYALRATDTFSNPSVGGNRLDACLHWGVECGQAAANEFCKTKGFTGAKSFAYAYDIGAQTPTLVMGDNKVCNAASCDGFASIACQ